MRTDLTIMQVEAVRRMLSDAGMDDDERLLLDTLEGETDLFELTRRLLNGIEADAGDAASLKEQIDNRKARAERCKARIDARRAAIRALMECAGVDKLPLPEATITLRDGKLSLAVTDEAAVPDEYQVTTKRPDKRAINDAFADADQLPNWLTRQDAEPVLTVRTK